MENPGIPPPPPPDSRTADLLGRAFGTVVGGFDVVDDGAGQRRRRRRRAAVVAFLVVVLASTLGYLVGNEIQANTQFDQAHRSLDATRVQIRGVGADLACRARGSRRAHTSWAARIPER